MLSRQRGGRVHYQVIIIGGGPIGAATARYAAEAGASTLLVERRARPADVPACTGLVSPRALPALGASDRSVLREIRGLAAHSPGRRTLRLRADEVKALVLDRIALEAELLALAEAVGVEIRMGTEGQVTPEGRVLLESRAGSEALDTGVVIGADGPDSAVACGRTLHRRTVLVRNPSYDRAFGTRPGARRGLLRGGRKPVRVVRARRRRCRTRRPPRSPHSGAGAAPAGPALAQVPRLPSPLPGWRADSLRN